MTEAASRNVLRRTTDIPLAWLDESGFGFVCNALAMACAARRPVPEGNAAARVALSALFCSTTVSLDPSGSTLSVSRRMSLMFFSRDSQNWLCDVFSIRVLEMLPELPPTVGGAPFAPPEIGVPVAIWVLADTVPVTLRAML